MLKPDSLSWSHHKEIAALDGALGFKESTAYLLIKASQSNFQLTGSLDETQALTINRQIWGNTNHRALGAGLDE